MDKRDYKDRTTMKAMDAVHGAHAECFVTIGDDRYNFMQMTEFEGKYELNIVDVPILGRVTKGNKVAGGSGTWSGTAHFNQSLFRLMLVGYMESGAMPAFKIQVTNSDPSSSAGSQSIIYEGCLFDSVILSKFAAGEDILDEEISGTFEDFKMAEAFKLLEGMYQGKKSE